MALSSEVCRLRNWIKEPAETDHWIKQGLFKLAHSSHSYLMMEELAVAVSFATAMKSSLNFHEVFHVIIFTIGCAFGGYYQFFFLQRLDNLVHQLKNFAVFAKRLEENLTEEENLILTHEMRRLRCIYNISIVACIPKLIAAFLQPIHQVSLPTFLKDLSPYHPFMITVRVFMTIMSFQIFVAAMQFSLFDMSVVYYTKSVLKVLTKRFRNVDTKLRRNVEDIVKLHSELLTVSGTFVNLLKDVNSAYVFQAVIIPVFATVGAVVGIRTPDVLFMIPLCFLTISIFCFLSDMMETASSKIGVVVYGSQWVGSDENVKRMLLFVMEAGKQLVQLLRMVHIVIELIYTWLGTALWAKNLRGLRIVVTGAGRPIGSEISEQLASLGCHVLCVDGDPTALDGVMMRIRAAAASADAPGLPEPRFYVCDVTQKDAVLKLAQDVADEGWAVDILVLSPPSGSSAAECLSQHFLPALAFVPGMVTRGNGGHVVFMEDSSTPTIVSASAEAWTECFSELDQTSVLPVQVTSVRLGEAAFSPPSSNRQSAAYAARCVVSAVRRDARCVNVSFPQHVS